MKINKKKKCIFALAAEGVHVLKETQNTHWFFCPLTLAKFSSNFYANFEQTFEMLRKKKANQECFHLLVWSKPTGKCNVYLLQMMTLYMAVLTGSKDANP